MYFFPAIEDPYLPPSAPPFVLLIYFPCPRQLTSQLFPPYRSVIFSGLFFFSLSLCVVSWAISSVASRRAATHTRSLLPTTPALVVPASITSTHLSTSRYCKSSQANLCKIYPQTSIILILIIIPATVYLFPLAGLLPLTLSSITPPSSSPIPPPNNYDNIYPSTHVAFLEPFRGKN